MTIWKESKEKNEEAGRGRERKKWNEEMEQDGL